VPHLEYQKKIFVKLIKPETGSKIVIYLVIFLYLTSSDESFEFGNEFFNPKIIDHLLLRYLRVYHRPVPSIASIGANTNVIYFGKPSPVLIIYVSVPSCFPDRLLFGLYCEDWPVHLSC